MGIAIGICIAWPILTFATHNFIVGALATLVISIITVSVIGVIPLAGWKLGVCTAHIAWFLDASRVAILGRGRF